MIALGAHGVLLGRDRVYAFAAAGEAGVAYVIQLVEAEMRFAMALTGCTNIAAIDRLRLVRQQRRSGYGRASWRRARAALGEQL